MGFFSNSKSRNKIYIGNKVFFISLCFCLLVFTLSLGPFLRIDPSQRKSFVSNLSNAPDHIIQGAEETFYQPKLGSTSSKKFSFSYVHGFSASRPELSPLIENLADYFAAPVFFPRLAGHGIDDKGESLSQANCFDWLNDSDRAVEKAKLSGRELILIGMSFGGLMSTFATLEHQVDIKALILISPIFELPNPIARFVSGPLGPILARIILGPYYEFTPKNEMNARYWTTRYSTKLIPQLMDCENFMRVKDLSKIKIPLLVLYTERDDVVSVQAIKDRFKDFGSSKKLLVDVPGANDHVLTGNIISPQTLPFVEKTMKNFLESL